MKNIAIFLSLATTVAQADVVLGAGGMYSTSSAGSTSYVIQNSHSDLPVAGVTTVGTAAPVITTTGVPLMLPPPQGVRTYITPTGTYVVSASGSTTFVIQSGRTRGR